jgi:hypothetical protein
VQSHNEGFSSIPSNEIYQETFKHLLGKIKVILNKSFIYKKLTFLFSLAIVNFHFIRVLGVREIFSFLLDGC